MIANNVNILNMLFFVMFWENFNDLSIIDISSKYRYKMKLTVTWLFGSGFAKPLFFGDDFDE